jgi:hypothetical protein
MKVFHALPEGQELAGGALALGNFDGVHLGHQALFAVAGSLGVPAALTFEPHPGKVLQPELAPKLLTTLGRKLELFSAYGLKAALVVPFTRAYATTSAEVFEASLLDGLKVSHLVVGQDFTYGARRSGTVATLIRAAAARSAQVQVVEPVTVEGGGGIELPHPRVPPGRTGRRSPGAPRAGLRLGRGGGEGSRPRAYPGLAHRQRGDGRRDSPWLRGVRRAAAARRLRERSLARGCGQRGHKAHLRGPGRLGRGARPRLVGGPLWPAGEGRIPRAPSSGAEIWLGTGTGSADSRLGELLVRQNLISFRQLRKAQDEQTRDGGRLGYHLIKTGAIEEQKLTDFLSKQYGVPAINLKDFDIEPDVIKLVPEGGRREAPGDSRSTGPDPR